MTETLPPEPRFPRPTIGHVALNLLVTLYVMGVLNTGVWSRLMLQFPDRPVNVALFGLAFSALTFLTLELLGPWRLQKPVAAALIVIAASAAYFERAFGTLVDRELVRSVFETTPTEAQHLVTLGAVGWIGLTGVVPVALVFWPRVSRVGIWHQLWRWPLAVMLSLVVVLFGLFADYAAASSTLREHQDIAGAYQPGATLAALVRYGKEQLNSGERVLQPVGEDAAPGPLLETAPAPVLMVLFVGETLRAQNFGLDGYARDTTPGLAERAVINLPDAHSCGTATAVSLPCMFSPLTQADYSREAFLGRENLLDVLARAGFDVRWVDNNTGDQHIAARLGWERVDEALDPAACAVECTDEVFLPLIEQTAATITRNTVLVLHMIGNHGPAYYLRYPEERAQFTPDCQTAQFADCSAEEIVNAYDNAVLETDHVLSRAIDILQASDRVTPAMVFLSDHGESLGEGGLYLHAAPMFMAPEEQTHVPMLMWLGARFRTAMRLDEGCLRDVAQERASHDMLFSSMLGLLDVQTEVRDPALDLTATCRREDQA
ncbi:phosphoethanolamine transferase [Pararhodobacter sp. CCB-MM2]|uniref:phosphoethanolamine transferase n=1 Tax=Pararhodobacter sp. CCB-MM2 TaxID=1786003 RepID=UPI0008374613|nr:sulfatase-like hydrolase/transferase [Pararhodobacter sp. CCB-MM2]